MNNTQKLCRLCLKELSNHCLESLGDSAWDILTNFNIKINLDISEEPVICEDCSENVRKLSSFKAICVETQNRLLPFVNLETNEKIDLPQVYLILNEGVILGDMNICRFCMCRTPSNFSIHWNINVDVMSPIRNFLEISVPELDLSLVRDPIACKRCHNCLQECLTFTRNCTTLEENLQKYITLENLHVEGKIDLRNVKQFLEKVVINKEIEDVKDVKDEMQQNDDFMENLSSVIAKVIENCMQIEVPPLNIKNEEAEFKLILDSSERWCYKASTEMTATNQVSKTMHESNVDYYKDTCDSAVYKCCFDTCSYETKYKTNLSKHEIIHKDLSEITVYKCKVEGCLFETKYKSSLQRHQVMHKNPSEIKIYKCGYEDCSYETKHRPCFLKHIVIHNDSSEVTIYKCVYQGCLYETRYKAHLAAHKLFHKGTPQVIYKCEHEGCSFTTKRKYSLKKHIVIHKDVTIYKCVYKGCLYKTRHKHYLTRHELIHKDPSEVTMYKCGVEGCLYKTKYKHNWTNHTAIHKDLSEDTTYKCDVEGCLYKTKNKHNWTLHAVTHKDSSEVRMYSCEYKDFIRNQIQHQFDLI